MLVLVSGSSYEASYKASFVSVASNYWLLRRTNCWQLIQNSYHLKLHWLERYIGFWFASLPKIFIASNWISGIGNRTMSFLLSNTNGIMLTLGYVIWVIKWHKSATKSRMILNTICWSSVGCLTGYLVNFYLKIIYAELKPGTSKNITNFTVKRLCDWQWLRQWGAGNVYLLVLSTWKVNITETPIAMSILKVLPSKIYHHCYCRLRL